MGSAYAYVGNRPTVMVDPSGMVPDGPGCSNALTCGFDWFNEHLNPGYMYLNNCFGTDDSFGEQSFGSWAVSCTTGATAVTAAGVVLTGPRGRVWDG